jgi:hypothetical protein
MGPILGRPRCITGRTVPTYTQLISVIAAKWSKFRRVLRHEDQVHFDRLLRAVKYFAPAGMYQCSDDPRESVVLSMLLSHETRVAAMEAKLKMPQVHFPEAQPMELFSAESSPASTEEDVGEATDPE